LEAAGVPPTLYNHENYVKSEGGILEGLEYFDAFFFGYTALEAKYLDLQVRLFHECSWEALEDAGYNSETYEGLIGIYGGAEDNIDWRARIILESGEDGGGYTRSILGNKDFMTTRISYKLNLTGPSYTISTGCSSALVSIHMACRNLLAASVTWPWPGGSI